MYTQPSITSCYEDPPVLEGEGWRGWITRAANFAIVLIEAEAGARLGGSCIEEHFAYSLPGGCRILAGCEQASLGAEDLAVLPPGDWEVSFDTAGLFVRVVTSAEEIAGQASNAATYAQGDRRAVPVTPWPPAEGGFRLRTYSTLEGYARGGLVHAYRTSKLMIVPYPRFLEPRNETDLSPHAHEDFEQASVALEGQWQHHLRVPWTKDRREWQADRDITLGSPSVLVIPAGVIHTSLGTGGDGMRLIDVFSPPRRDFSERGLVNNAEDYPVPEGLATT